MPQDKVSCSPDPLEIRFQEQLLSIWPKGVPQRLLVAVSGGADSTALALLCWSFFSTMAREGIYAPADNIFPMAIAHFHHHLRPIEADGDEAFVCGLADRLGVPYRRGDWTREEQGKLLHEDRNLQAAARRARYEFLIRTAKDLDLPVLVTAHHRDDQVETVMFNLSRGGGTGAWRGIRSAIQRQGIWILRPLLPFTKEELLAYLEQRGEAHREDSSNQSRKYSRNRIRHDLLPEAVAKDPGYVELLLARNASAQTEETHWLGVLESFKKEGLFQESFWTLPRRQFAEMTEEGHFYCLRQLLWEFSGAGEGWFPIRRRSLSTLSGWLSSGKDGEVTFPGEIRVKLHGGALILHRKK